MAKEEKINQESKQNKMDDEFIQNRIKFEKDNVEILVKANQIKI